MEIVLGCPRNIRSMLPLSISISGKCYRFYASRVLSDPLDELLAAAIWCLDCEYPFPPVDQYRNPPHSRVDARGCHFWREPAWHTLLLIRLQTSDKIGLRFYANHDGGLQVDEDDFRTSTELVIESLRAIEFAREVHRAITDIRRSSVGEFDKLCWFPHGLLEDLDMMVRHLE